MNTPSPLSSLDGDTYTVSLTGEIDISREPELQDLVTGFADSTAPNALVDLTAVTFMDSSGISTLLALHHTAASRRGQVHLLDPPNIATRVLEITGVAPLFQIINHHTS